MARKVQVDMKAGQLNREGKGQGGYKKTGHNEAATGQTRTSKLGDYPHINYDVYAMTGPSTKRDHAPKMPKGK